MQGMEIAVLRYGHRQLRDYRVTTHCCLVARAFGAKKIIIDGGKDEGIKESVSSVVKNWGGKFSVEFTQSWLKTLREHKKRGFFTVHLTMYGLQLQREARKLRKKKKILLVIGSQKVPGAVYRESDANISVTSQPHSEIAALAVALDWLQKGGELGMRFRGAGMEITPQKCGKRVRKEARE